VGSEWSQTWRSVSGWQGQQRRLQAAMPLRTINCTSAQALAIRRPGAPASNAAPRWLRRGRTFGVTPSWREGSLFSKMFSIWRFGAIFWRLVGGEQTVAGGEPLMLRVACRCFLAAPRSTGASTAQSPVDGPMSSHTR
jgi:hypothetical protein